MKSYKKILLFIPIFYLSYVVVAVAGMGRSTNIEYFPFFSWSLFTFVKEERADFGVRVTKINGVPSQEPGFLLQMAEHHGKVASINAYKLISRLGGAIFKGDKELTRKLRQVLEDNYLGNHEAIEYEIVLRRYKPLDRWHSGRFTGQRTLGTFRSGKFDS